MEHNLTDICVQNPDVISDPVCGRPIRDEKENKKVKNMEMSTIPFRFANKLMSVKRTKVF